MKHKATLLTASHIFNGRRGLFLLQKSCVEGIGEISKSCVIHSWKSSSRN
uniref:Uncharacterized protein n=1 Tax=Tetraselmis sp. GSL018 TaxID=582737 RepID=A0A061RH90_9CHLO